MITGIQTTLLTYLSCGMVGYGVGMVIVKIMDHVRQERIFKKIMRESGYDRN